jgi:hypothetical protein
MAGNEKIIAKFLVLNIEKISLPHLGKVTSIGAPISGNKKCAYMVNQADVEKCLATEDSRKKADIYINGKGVSLKQKGSSFSYNRLQRSNLIEVFNLLKFVNSKGILQRLDNEVRQFHEKQLERRNRPWNRFFTEDEFKELTRFLMMKGAPNVGWSSHPAEFILEAPIANILENQISVFTFGEYFEEYKDKFKIAIRRQWYGQISESEHKRASGLMKKQENMPWVFEDVAGQPNIHKLSGRRWRKEIPENERKTVYFLMIEKER